MEEETEAAFATLLATSTQHKLNKALETLADGSKKSDTIRQRLAEPPILESLIQMIQPQELNPQLTHNNEKSALRCLGNACIDNDEARTFVASRGFQWSIPLLQRKNDLELRKLTALVLYNICSDHEVAQQQAYNDAVHIQVIDLLGDTVEDDTMPERPRLIELLFWLSIHHVAAQDEPAFAETGLRTLLSLPTRLDFDKDDTEPFAELVEASLGFLRDEQIQQQAIKSNLDHLIFEILERNELQIYRAESEADVKLLVPISASLTWVLSDLVALPSFVPKNPDAMKSNLVSKAITTILTFGGNNVSQAGSNDARLVNAACQVVGNYVFASTPATYEGLISEKELHVAILTLMNRVDNSDFLHSATGLLILLSRASGAAREAIGAEPCAAVVLNKVCHSEVRQLKEGGVKLIRALGRHCPSNQQRFADLARQAITDLAASPEQNQIGIQPRNDTVDAT